MMKGEEGDRREERGTVDIPQSTLKMVVFVVVVMAVLSICRFSPSVIVVSHLSHHMMVQQNVRWRSWKKSLLELLQRERLRALDVMQRYSDQQASRVSELDR